MPLLLAMFLSLSAQAQAGTAHEAFDRVNRCVQANTPARCRPMLTKASLPIYDRFVSYGLTQCLPKDSAYLSEQVTPHGITVRAQSNASGKPRTLRLAFTREGDTWLLDIPESLHAGMGDNWENQLNATEQIFLMMRAQMGDQLNCGLIQGLAKK